MLVVGGGAAGLSAAIAAAELGADVVLCDEGAEPGGRLLAEGGHERARELTARAREAGVEVLANAPALGAFDGLVPIWQGDTLHQVRAAPRRLRDRHDRAAAGVPRQRPPRRDAVRRRPPAGRALRGSRPARARSSRPSATAASRPPLALTTPGSSWPRVADLRSNGGTSAALNELMRRGVRPLRGMTVLEARGSSHVQGAVVGTPGAEDGEGEHAFGCDLLVVSGGSAPATSLLTQAGGSHRLRPRARRLRARRTLPDGVFAAGEVAGAGALEDARALGRDGRRWRPPAPDASLRCAAKPAHSRTPATADGHGALASAAAPTSPCRRPVTSQRKGKCFACLCEDVTAKDIHLSVEEGYDSIELSKRYTTTTMGPCQGRMCQLPAVRLMAEETGQSLEEVGTTTARPPWHAVPMGALAGPPLRAGQALVDPRAPPRARRQRHVGGRLAPRLRLRRPAAPRRWRCTRRPA